MKPTSMEKAFSLRTLTGRLIQVRSLGKHYDRGALVLCDTCGRGLWAQYPIGGEFWDEIKQM